MGRGKNKKATARMAAIAAGENTYQGRPCKQGHIGLRYTGSMDCVDCARAYRRNAAMWRRIERFDVEVFGKRK